VLRWLTRLFKQEVEAEAPAAVAPTPETPPKALEPPTGSDIAVALADPGQPELAIVEAPVRAAAEPEPKETCPTCGRTSVFAGPPGQRFCTYCALRDELFDRQAAAQD
jgi:hypothetical protein